MKKSLVFLCAALILFSSSNTQTMHAHTRHPPATALGGLGGSAPPFSGPIMATAATMFWVTMMATVIFAPVWYRLGRWIRFQLKSFNTRHREALQLLEKYEKRYGPAISTVNGLKEKAEANQEAGTKKAVTECYSRYLGMEGHTWLEFFRKCDWLSNYSALVPYPFLHCENRIINAIGWLQQYRNSLHGPIVEQIDHEIVLLQELLQHIRSSYGYTQEKNQKIQAERLADIQAKQARQEEFQQQILGKLDAMQPSQQGTSAEPPAYNVEDSQEPRENDAPPVYSIDDPYPR